MSDLACPLSILAASAVTASGATLEQTATSVRAGLLCRREHAFYRALSPDPDFVEKERLVVARVPHLPVELAGRDRLLTLLIPVLGDLLESASWGRRDLAKTALLLALPGPDSAVSEWGLDELLPDLTRRSGLVFRGAKAATSGHAAALSLLSDAATLISGGEVEACVVAGVDSYLSLDRMEALDSAYRLKSRRNADGFCPGEAAAALLVEGPKRRPRAAASGGHRPDAARAKITAVGVGEEVRTARSEKLSSGVGLTSALRGVLREEGSPSWVLCDLNGESYRAFEWGVALARLGARLSGIERLTLPAMSFGDVGAATGVLLPAIASEGLRRGWAPSDEAILWTASDERGRSAARLTSSGETR